MNKTIQLDFRMYCQTVMRHIGAGIVGVNTSGLLDETVLAMEIGADLDELALTIHAHPTLSKTPMFAAEMGLGSVTDLCIPPKKNKPAFCIGASRAASDFAGRFALLVY